MAVRVNVYKNQTLVDSLEILRRFHIMEDSNDDVFWDAPPETLEERIRRRSLGWKPRGGSLLFECDGSEHQKTTGWLLSRWDLYVNGQQCPKGSYRKLTLKWPRVDLVYKSYRFEFLSPKFDNTQEPLPQPSKPRT